MYLKHLVQLFGIIAAFITTTTAGPVCRPFPYTNSSVTQLPTPEALSRRSTLSHIDANTVCIDFTFDNPNWYFSQQPPWGDQTGTFGSLKNGRMCMPRTNLRGGALFIGAHPVPAANTTKLECFFPPSEQANCDISLVDGFSLPLTCSMGNQRMGGVIDLWSTGIRCENESYKHLGVCTNTRELHAEENVPAFFQPAIRNGNSYCIWTKCTQNPFFLIQDQLRCHVGPTILSPGVL